MSSEQHVKPAPWEFRARVWIVFVIYSVAFFAGYSIWIALGHEAVSSFVLVGAPWGAVGIRSAASVAAALTIVGFALRWWGSSYHCAGVVFSGSIEAASLTAEGPYRYVRNPLYLGNILQAIGISALGPPPVMIICVGLVTAFLLRLIDLEERFLRAAHGERYLRYCAAVPRIIPRLSAPDLPTSGQRPHAISGLVTELGTLGFAVAMTYLAVKLPSWNDRTFLALFYLSFLLFFVGGIANRLVARSANVA